MMDPVRKAVTAAVEAHLESLDAITPGYAQVTRGDDHPDVYTLVGKFDIDAMADVAIVAALRAIRDPGIAIFTRHTVSPRPVSFIHQHVIDDMLAQLGALPDLETERTEALEGK